MELMFILLWFRNISLRFFQCKGCKLSLFGWWLHIFIFWFVWWWSLWLLIGYCTLQLSRSDLVVRCTLQLSRSGLVVRCTLQLLRSGLVVRCTLQLLRMGPVARCTLLLLALCSWLLLYRMVNPDIYIIFWFVWWWSLQLLVGCCTLQLSRSSLVVRCTQLLLVLCSWLLLWWMFNPYILYRYVDWKFIYGCGLSIQP